MLVAPGTRLVRAANPSLLTGLGTNTYLIGTTDVVVIDPGPDLDDHVSAIIDQASASGGRIVGAIVTHEHPDHLAGAYTLRARTGAPIYGHPALPRIDNALADGEHVAVGRAKLRVIETPGHSDSHLCLWQEDESLLFTGDLIAGSGTVVLSDTPNALTHYIRSLEKVQSLGASTILPGHGPVITDGHRRIQVYLEHRAMRDRQILEALARESLTVPELVRRVYTDLDPKLTAYAARNVRAHLERLLALGHVDRRGDAWIAVASSHRGYAERD